MEHTVTGGHWGQDLKKIEEGLVSYVIARLPSFGIIYVRFEKDFKACAPEKYWVSQEINLRFKAGKKVPDYGTALLDHN